MKTLADITEIRRYAGNRVVETLDVQFNTETGNLDCGKCMSIQDWCHYINQMAHDNSIVQDFLETSAELTKYLEQIMELREGDAYWVAQHYFDQQIPMQVMIDIDYEVGRNQLEYADNYRAYRLKDGLGQLEFDHNKRNGCCGEFESSTIVDGDQWIIGCNHGH